MAIGIKSYRPTVSGSTHMVTAGHYLATASGYRILEQGGNATDAGVAAGITLNVVLPQWTNFGGVAPIIIHDAQKKETVEISGLGRWPKAANIDDYLAKYGGDLPAGIPRTVTPAGADAWMTALKLYGTMTFEQVVPPAMELAENGFPVPATLASYFAKSAGDDLTHETDDQVQWPSTAEIFYPGGRAFKEGETLVQKDLAHSFKRLIEAEKKNASLGREGAIQAARDFFYKGEIAQEIVDFHQANGGLITMEDLADFHVGVNAPAHGTYKGIDVYTCGPWCQGPVSIQALQILEGMDLNGMGHNSADYVHAVLEALSLAISDREAYYGDPDFVDVPMEGLLSKSFAEERRAMIDMKKAFGEMPEAGNPWRHQGMESPNGKPARPEPVGGGQQADTSYTAVIDRWGNAFSATPSDTIAYNPIIPGLGFSASGRGSQSWLDHNHPSSLQPGKRPRLTPNPALAMKDGKVLMPFGTPGGDVQPQSMVQLFLNVVEFGMEVQEAIEAPRVSTWGFPNSFWPHAYNPGFVGVEGRISPEVVEDLRKRGHAVEVWDDFTPRMGCLCAIHVDQERGSRNGGADPRRDGYAMGR